MKKYSLVVHPIAIIDKVKALKQVLKGQIGWYNSVNSLAHLSICEFYAEDQELESIIAMIQEMVKDVEPKEITLDSFAFYDNGAFYMKANQESESYLKDLFVKINSGLAREIKLGYKVTAPHLSIGRRLSQEQLAIAQEVFQQVEERFICESIMLRVFNPIRKQYDLFREIRFNTEKE